jgi:hypothetical protein
MNEQMRLRDAEFGLSIRTWNCLCNDYDKDTALGEIAQKSDAELLKTPNFGKKSLHEFREFMGAPEYVSPRIMQMKREAHERNKEVYDLREQGMTYRAIAARLGYNPKSPERIRQRYHSYLRDLKYEQFEREQQGAAK